MYYRDFVFHFNFIFLDVLDCKEYFLDPRTIRNIYESLIR